jgi:hypothetical protein
MCGSCDSEHSEDDENSAVATPRSFLLSPPALIAGAVSGVLAVSLALPHGRVDGMRLCVWYHLFGITCPFCGMSRGFVAISHGDIAAAIDFNPASPIIYSALLWALFASIWAMKAGRWDSAPRPPDWLRYTFYAAAFPLFAWLTWSRIITLML